VHMEPTFRSNSSKNESLRTLVVYKRIIWKWILEKLYFIDVSWIHLAVCKRPRNVFHTHRDGPGIFFDRPRDHKIFDTPHNWFRPPVMWSCVSGCLPTFRTNVVYSFLQNSAATHQKMWYHLPEGPNPQLCRCENPRSLGSFNLG
jgi:hypothetical protein